MTTTADATTTGPRQWTGAPPDSRWLTEAAALAEELAPGAAGADESGSFVHGGFALLRERGIPIVTEGRPPLLVTERVRAKKEA